MRLKGKCVRCRSNDVLIDAPTCKLCGELMCHLQDKGSSVHFMFKCSHCAIYSPLHNIQCDKCWEKTPKVNIDNQYWQEPVKRMKEK